MKVFQNVKWLERIQCALVFFVLIWVLVLIINIGEKQVALVAFQEQTAIMANINHLNILTNQELFKKILLDPNYQFPTNRFLP
jgi:hypothetical protein